MAEKFIVQMDTKQSLQLFLIHKQEIGLERTYHESLTIAALA